VVEGLACEWEKKTKRPYFLYSDATVAERSDSQYSSIFSELLNILHSVIVLNQIIKKLQLQNTYILITEELTFKLN